MDWTHVIDLSSVRIPVPGPGGPAATAIYTGTIRAGNAPRHASSSVGLTNRFVIVAEFAILWEESYLGARYSLSDCFIVAGAQTDPLRPDRFFSLSLNAPGDCLRCVDLASSLNDEEANGRSSIYGFAVPPVSLGFEVHGRAPRERRADVHIVNSGHSVIVRHIRPFPGSIGYAARSGFVLTGEILAGGDAREFGTLSCSIPLTAGFVAQLYPWTTLDFDLDYFRGGLIPPMQTELVTQGADVLVNEAARVTLTLHNPNRYTAFESCTLSLDPASLNGVLMNPGRPWSQSLTRIGPGETRKASFGMYGSISGICAPELVLEYDLAANAPLELRHRTQRLSAAPICVRAA